MKRIKIPRAESCDVPIVYIKSWPYYIYMTMVCTGSPGQTKTDIGLKFGTHTPLDKNEKWVFCFFQKVTLRVARLEKLPCHAGFPHIPSIALFRVKTALESI